jgi:Icc-related predicted phosphoesterase
MDMTRIVYVTDVHGDLEIYGNLLEIGKEKNIEAIVIGGDLGPFTFDIEVQREFFESYIIPLFASFKEKYKKDIILIAGNDDFSVNMDLFENAEKSGILKLLNNKVCKVGVHTFAGYPFVNPGPLIINDWIKSEKEISNDLKKLAKKSQPKKTVYIIHAPPANTKLDTLYSGEHVGSTAVRDLIEKEQPLLTLHGHVHESPDMSGEIQEKIGDTLSINPGSSNIIVIDLEKLDDVKVLK